MMNSLNLKTKLLDIGLVIENDYLYKYIELIINNSKPEKIKYKTQTHHIIPRYFYKLNNLEINDDDENLSILSHKDHMLAHYYLALCSANDMYRYCNELALRRCLNNSSFKLDENFEQDKQFIQSLDKYQELKEHCNATKRPAELLKQISQSLKKVKHTEEWNKKISQSNKGKKLSETHKKKLSKSHTGKKCMNKDGIFTYVSEENVQKYLDMGYILGGKGHEFADDYEPWNKGKTITECPSLAHPWSEEKKKARCGEGNPMWGKKKTQESIEQGIKTRKEKGNLNQTEESKIKISNTLKGYVSVWNPGTDDVRHIRPELLDYYLENGYIKSGRKKITIKENKKYEN